LHGNQFAAIASGAASSLPLTAGIDAAKFLVGGYHLKKIDIRDDFDRPAQAIIIRQGKVVADEVTGSNIQVFKIDQLITDDGAGMLFGQEVDGNLIRADDTVIQVETAQPVVVGRFDLEHDLLQGHHVLVAPGAAQGQLRRLI